MFSANDRGPRPLPDAAGARAGVSAALMYEPFYGLHEKPFSLSADPRFLFRSPAHGTAFDELLAGIQRREGLIVLTGEIGTGKTTLCRSVLQHLDRRTFAAFVPDPFVSREDLLKTLLVDFGVISIADLTRGRFNGASRSDLSYQLYEFLDSLVPLQAFAVLVIDEAQNLSLPLLEEIRILSELERREKLLQVVLVGQPELRSSLRLPEMRQVDQRISVRCDLTALDAKGVAGYVSHRLEIAGRGGSRVVITSAALDAIYQGSSGVPRLINRICDRALQRAYAARTMQIDAPFVWAATSDLGLAATPAEEKRPANGTRPDANRPPVTETPLPVPMPAAATAAPLGSTLPRVADFRAQRDLKLFPSESDRHSGRWSRWAMAAAATGLAVSAFVGAAAWHTHAQASEAPETAQITAPQPASIVSQPVSVPSQPTSVPQVAASPSSEILTPAPPVAAVGASSAGPRSHRLYSILVASFNTTDRAQRSVEELTNAGFGAQAVEREAGPTHGRLAVVQVSGYTSEIDVQRDLELIRQLPGGYTDARIVEQN
jgi:general secretion pathway protein A